MKIGTFETSTRDIVKFVASVIVGLGTHAIVRSTIANNIPEPEGLAQKVTIGSAGLVVGTMAAERTKKWTDNKIDGIFDAWTDAAAEVEKKKSEADQK